MEDRSDIVINKVEKKDILILSSFVFVVMLIYNFGIKQMEFGDDAFFLKQFTHDFQSNYYEFLKFRYNEWTSRLVIEIALTQAVQHVFLWRVLNAIAMSIVAIVPALLFNSDNSRRGLIIGTGMSLLIPASMINNAGWIATTTNYVWVMAAALLSIWPIMNYIRGKSVNWISFILSLVFLIYATNQEQMVVIMLVSLLVLEGILYLSKKNILITLPHIAVVIASFVFILTCKGNAARNIQETKQWLPNFSSYSIFDKLQIGYSSTLKVLFFEWSPLMLAFVLLILTAGLVKNGSLLKKMISGIPLLTYLICTRFNTIIDQTYDIPSGKTYMSLVVLLTGLAFLYVIGIFAASNNYLEFLSVTFLLILGVGSRIMMGFSPTIWVSGSRTYYFTYVLIMMSGVYLIRQLPEGYKKNGFNVLCGYFIVLALLVAMIYIKYI